MARWVFTSIASTVCLLSVACSQSDDPVGPIRQKGASAAATFRPIIRGAGATFPFPVYSRWAFHRHEKTGLRLSYEQIGSRAGVEALKAGKVDFAASDIPLPDDELRRDGLIQFPMVIGGVVPVVNLPGVESGMLILSPKVLSMILLGQVTRWDAAEIRTENPDIILPDREITPVYRADSSGTTWIFTTFLNQCCKEWKSKVGVGSIVSWPVGVGAQGNDQVARFVRQFKFTIGYVDLAHATNDELAWVALTDTDGETVTPTLEGFEAAAAEATWNFETSARFDPADAKPSHWPIVGASYVLIKKQQTSKQNIRELLSFLHWALTEGAAIARDLQYATVPTQHVATIEELWKTEVRVGGEPVW